jgi:hypothetical protein
VALRYVYSGATGTGTGADWTNAYTTLSAAATASVNGDTIYVAHDHAENTTGAVTIQFPTGSSYTKVYCVNRAGSVPPVQADLRTTAVVQSNSTTGGADMAVGFGNVYVYGITFTAGTGNANFLYLRMGGAGGIYERCVFKMAGTSVSSRIYPTYTSGGETEWLNCQVEFGNVSQGVTMQNGQLFKWINDPSVPAFTSTSTVYPNCVIINGSSAQQPARVTVDFVGLPSGRSLTNFVTIDVSFINCKIPSGVTLASGTISSGSGPTQMINCNTGTQTLTRNERWTAGGTLTMEGTIVRTNGAHDGLSAYSWKNVNSAGANGAVPHSTFEGAILNTVVGTARTLTVHVVTNNVTLTTDDIWLELEYPASATSTLGQRLTSRTSILATASNLPTDTATWTTTGLATPVKQKLQITFTAQQAAPIRWRVKIAKPSATVYICPKADLS